MKLFLVISLISLASSLHLETTNITTTSTSTTAQPVSQPSNVSNTTVSQNVTTVSAPSSAPLPTTPTPTVVTPQPSTTPVPASSNASQSTTQTTVTTVTTTTTNTTNTTNTTSPSHPVNSPSSNQSAILSTIRSNPKAYDWYGINQDCIFKCTQFKGQVCGNKFYDCCTPGFCLNISNYQVCTKKVPGFSCRVDKKAKNIFPELSSKLIWD